MSVFARHPAAGQDKLCLSDLKPNKPGDCFADIGKEYIIISKKQSTSLSNLSLKAQKQTARIGW